MYVTKYLQKRRLLIVLIGTIQDMISGVHCTRVAFHQISPRPPHHQKFISVTFRRRERGSIRGVQVRTVKKPSLRGTSGEGGEGTLLIGDVHSNSTVNVANFDTRYCETSLIATVLLGNIFYIHILKKVGSLWYFVTSQCHNYPYPAPYKRDPCTKIPQIYDKNGLCLVATPAGLQISRAPLDQEKAEESRERKEPLTFAAKSR